jgi:hypothetical protein
LLILRILKLHCHGVYHGRIIITEKIFEEEVLGLLLVGEV